GGDHERVLDGILPDLRPEPGGRVVPERVRDPRRDRRAAGRRPSRRPPNRADRFDRRRDERAVRRDPAADGVHRMALPLRDPPPRPLGARHAGGGVPGMRRVAALAMLAALLLAGCANTDRLEGRVERWFSSLNQGAAGQPDRFAPRTESDAVLPGWEHCDPGGFDVIEVRGGTSVAQDEPVDAW